MSASKSGKSPRFDASIPDGIRAGFGKCHAMLLGVETMVAAHVRLFGDLKQEELCALVMTQLPATADEAIGFAMVLSEYLAASAEGFELYPDFTLSKPEIWRAVRREQAAVA